MNPPQLPPLLEDSAFGTDRVLEIAECCRVWYAQSATLLAFVFLGIFRDLIARGWDDPQGVNSAEFDRFTYEVLPRLRAALNCPDDLSASRIVTAYHGSL